MSRWGDRPVDQITKRDVIAMVDDINDRGAKRQAHSVFGHARAIFNWAINRGVYGIAVSPCDRIRPTQLIGPKACGNAFCPTTSCAPCGRQPGGSAIPTARCTGCCC